MHGDRVTYIHFCMAALYVTQFHSPYKNSPSSFSIQELIQKDHQNHSQFMPTVDCRYSLVNFRDVLISLYTKEWIQEINEIRTESGSGGRLNLYRALKVTPQTERYVVDTRKLGEEGDGWPAYGMGWD